VKWDCRHQRAVNEKQLLITAGLKELRPALSHGSEFSAEHLGSSLGSHQNVLKITDPYRKIHFAISGAKNKQWEALVKRRRDHRESGAFSPAHKLSASSTLPFSTSQSIELEVPLQKDASPTPHVCSARVRAHQLPFMN